MATTPRLSAQDSAALARQAEREGRSQTEVITQAVREYIERASRREMLDSVIADELPRYADALERLGK